LTDKKRMDLFNKLEAFKSLRERYESISVTCAQNIGPHRVGGLHVQQHGTSTKNKAAIAIVLAGAASLVTKGLMIIDKRRKEGSTLRQALTWGGLKKVRADKVIPNEISQQTKVTSTIPFVITNGNTFKKLLEGMNTLQMQYDWLMSVKRSFIQKHKRLKKTIQEINEQGGEKLKMAWILSKYHQKISNDNLKKAKQVGRSDVDIATEWQRLNQEGSDKQIKTKEGEVDAMADTIDILTSLNGGSEFLTNQLKLLEKEIRTYKGVENLQKLYKLEINDVEKDDTVGFVASFRATLTLFGLPHKKKNDNTYEQCTEDEAGCYIETSSHTEVWNQLAANILVFIRDPMSAAFTGKTFALAFMGPPGTGKSFTAEKWANLIISARIVPMQGAPTIVTAGSLIDRFKGGSRSRTTKLLYNNILRLLILDEAYSIAKLTGPGQFDSYGEEAADTLVGFFTEKQTSGLMTFFALGYVKEMQQQFFKINSGMASRFSIIVELQNIDSRVLWMIMTQKAKGVIFSRRAKNFILALMTNKDVFPGFVRDLDTFFHVIQVLFLNKRIMRIGVRETWEGLVNFMDKNIMHKGTTSMLPYTIPPFEVFEICDLFQDRRTEDTDTDIDLNCQKKTKKYSFKMGETWDVMGVDMTVRDVFGPDFGVIIFKHVQYDEDKINIDNGYKFAYLIGYTLTETPEETGCYLYQDCESPNEITRKKVKEISNQKVT
jgi:hypothetical protein